MSLFIVTDTKVAPYGDESVMGAVYEAEKLRDRTGKRVSVVRDAGLKSQRGICTFLGFPEWTPERSAAARTALAATGEEKKRGS